MNRIIRKRAFCLGIFLGLGLLSANSMAQTDQSVYDDSLQSGWENWSWSSTNLSAVSPVHSGTKSAQITYTAAWQGFYLHHASGPTNAYSALSFWIHGGGVDGRSIGVAGVLSNAGQASVDITPFIAGGFVSSSQWRQVTIPLSALHIDNKSDMTGFWLQDSSGGTQPAYYVDDIKLIASAPPAQVNITVDAGHIVRTVDQRMFGVNTAIWDSSLNTAASVNLLKAAGFKAFRFPGGSASDEYHWATNSSLNYTWQWACSFDSFANVARQVGSQVVDPADRRVTPRSRAKPRPPGDR